MSPRRDDEKKPHIGHWALPFFLHESNSIRLIKVIMIGFHTPGHHDEDSKPDIVVVTEPDVRESVPFPGKDLPRLAASILSCTNIDNALRKAKALANTASRRKETYRKFDFNKMDVVDAVKLAVHHGENWGIPKETIIRDSDIRILKGAYSYSERMGHGTNYIHQLIAIGKDIRHSIPIIVIKKSFKDFTEIIRLWDGGIRLLAGLLFLVLYPPLGDRYSFLSDNELYMNVKMWVNKLSGQDLVDIDLKRGIVDVWESIKLDGQ